MSRQSTLARLNAIPRQRLGMLPTPLVAARELGRAIGLPELWIKHDELIGFGFGGNKVRGLELLLADAAEKQADVIVTGAGAQSNHVRASAAAAAHGGLEMVAVYWGKEPNMAQGNHRLTRLLGAKTHFTNSLDRARVDVVIEEVAADLRASGRRPYAIPRGGACALGVLGHVLAVREFSAQCAALNLAPGVILLATGSGTTLAGWLLGSALLGAPWRLEGVTVSRPSAEVHACVATLAQAGAALLDMPASIAEADIFVHDGYIGEGYGIPTEAGDAAVQLAARVQGVFLDPTYTGKAFAAIGALATQGHFRSSGPVVFIHSGGEPALFADLQHVRPQ